MKDFPEELTRTFICPSVVDILLSRWPIVIFLLSKISKNRSFRHRRFHRVDHWHRQSIWTQFTSTKLKEIIHWPQLMNQMSQNLIHKIIQKLLWRWLFSELKILRISIYFLLVWLVTKTGFMVENLVSSLCCFIYRWHTQGI